MQTGEDVPIPVSIYPADEGIEEELFRRVAMLGRIKLQLPLLRRPKAHSQEIGTLRGEAGWNAWRGNARLPHHLGRGPPAIRLGSNRPFQVNDLH